MICIVGYFIGIPYYMSLLQQQKSFCSWEFNITSESEICTIMVFIISMPDQFAKPIGAQVKHAQWNQIHARQIILKCFVSSSISTNELILLIYLHLFTTIKNKISSTMSFNVVPVSLKTK